MTLEERREAFHNKYLKDLWQGKTPKYGGSYVHGSLALINWDVTTPAGASLAAAASAFFWNQLLFFAIGDLVENNNFHIIEQDLAQSYEQVDPVTYIFKIPSGVKFHDIPPANGRELKAQDVKYVHDVYRKTPAQEPAYVDVDTIEAVDDFTIRFKMKAPAAYFITSLSEPLHPIFPPEQHESGQLDRGPVGTGAFVLESFQERTSMKAHKHPDYFKVDRYTNMKLPYLDRLDGIFFADPAADMAAFRSRQTHRFVARQFEQWVDVVKTNPEVIWAVTAPPASFQPHFAMQLGKAPFDDVRVRRALSLALDRDSIIKLFEGMAGYSFGLNWDYFGQEWPWSKEQLAPWIDYKPEQAKELLKEAGYSDGISGLELNFSQPDPIHTPIWLAALDMWRKVGVNVESKPLETGAFLDVWYNNKYKDMASSATIGPSAEPHTFTYYATHSASPKNYYNIKDPKNDELTEKQRRILDVEERKKVLKEWMGYQLEQMYRLWTVSPYRVAARHPFVYNATDNLNAWEPGWGAKVRERIWLDT